MAPVTKRALLVWLGAIVIVAITGALVLIPRSKSVQVVAVERADAERTLAVNGRIRPRQSVDVQSPVAGTVLELPFDVGDRVAAGVPIARIDDGPQRAAIAEATAAIAAQEAVVAQADRKSVV